MSFLNIIYKDPKKSSNKMYEPIFEADRSLIREVKNTLLFLDQSKLKTHGSKFDTKVNKTFESTKDYARVLQLVSNYGMIGGSFALRFYNLIDRKPKDIDLIVTDEKVGEDLLKYHEKKSDKYYYHKELPFKRLGCARIFGIDVDIFLDKSSTYYEYMDYEKRTLRVQKPLEVISKKIEIYSIVGREKCKSDLIEIDKKLKSL